MASTWEQPKSLSGAELTLTPLTPADAADFRMALGSPAEAALVLEHLAYAPPADDAEAVQLIDRAVADVDRWPFAQRLTATGALVGTTSFYEIRPEVRAIAIGHTWVGRPYWRSAVNSASKLIMMAFAFDELGAERVVWHTDIRNLRSQAAIQRLGAQREGVLRHHRIRRDGSWRDTVQYSMLAGEWPAARDRLHARLRDRSALQGVDHE